MSAPLRELDGTREAIAAYLGAEQAWLRGDFGATRRAARAALDIGAGPETERRAAGFLRVLAPDPAALAAGAAVALVVLWVALGAWLR
jgi:hypothetical protein